MLDSPFCQGFLRDGASDSKALSPSTEFSPEGGGVGVLLLPEWRFFRRGPGCEKFLELGRVITVDALMNEK